jgi:hypothetical protein
MQFTEWLLTEEKRDKGFFDYGSVAGDMWRNRLKDAREKFGVSFDTENDNAGDQREIVIDQDFWDHTKCKFRCEIHYACGDWENTVCYFRCQIVDGYADCGKTYGDPYFVVIPPREAGNVNLVRGKKGKWCASTEDRAEKPNDRAAWKWLKGYLKGAVDREVEKVKKGRSDH